VELSFQIVQQLQAQGQLDLKSGSATEALDDGNRIRKVKAQRRNGRTGPLGCDVRVLLLLGS